MKYEQINRIVNQLAGIEAAKTEAQEKITRYAKSNAMQKVDKYYILTRQEYEALKRAPKPKKKSKRKLKLPGIIKDVIRALLFTAILFIVIYIAAQRS